MTSISRFLVLVLVLAGVLYLPVGAFAEGEGGDPDAIGHSADGYYLDFSPVGKVELPRMFLLRTDNGIRFDAFMNTHAALESHRYDLLDAEGHRLSEEGVEAAIAAHTHFKYPLVPKQGQVIIDFSITRQAVFVLLIGLILIVMGLRLAARYKKGIGRESAPRGPWQNMMESVILFIRDDLAKPAIGPRYNKYVPYLLTLFLFILLGNLIGLLPWGVVATSGIAVTGALAVITFVITQVSGTKEYWAHIFNPPGVPWFVKPIIIPVEFLGLFTKPITLAIRLFANMVSGHLIIVSLLGLIFIFSAQLGTGAGIASIFISIPMTIFIYLLKILVSLIQAYIFTMLSAIYFGLALEEHDHGHEHDDVHELPEARPTIQEELAAVTDAQPVLAG